MIRWPMRSKRARIIYVQRRTQKKGKKVVMEGCVGIDADALYLHIRFNVTV